MFRTSRLALISVFSMLNACGGNNIARALDWVRVYDLDDDVWSTKTPLPSALGFARAEPANNGIVVIGTDQTLSYSPADDPL